MVQLAQPRRRVDVHKRATFDQIFRQIRVAGGFVKHAKPAGPPLRSAVDIRAGTE